MFCNVSNLASLVKIGLGFYFCSSCYINTVNHVTALYFLQVEIPNCKHKKLIATKIFQDVENIAPIQICFTKKNIKTQNIAIKDTLKMVSFWFSKVCLPDTKMHNDISSRFLCIHLERLYFLLYLEKQKPISANRMKKLHDVRVSRRRLKKKVAKMENILLVLKSKMFINTEEELLSNIETRIKDFLKRFLETTKSQKEYSNELRKFALHLHFISPKTCLFVRKTCWHKVVGYDHGFTKESFETIKVLVNKSALKIVNALSMVKLAIRQHLTWYCKKMVGYMDVGDHLYTSISLITKDGLVFFVTAINGAWKLPVGYF